MAVCKGCGVEAGLLSSYCPKCASERWVTPQAEGAGRDPREDGHAASAAAPAAWRGSATLCVLLGLACMAIGAYLLVDPTVTVPGYAGIGTDKVANIHMMTLGETLAIVGAIFLAAGIRPR